VVHRLGSVAYELALPSNAHIHLVFDVSYLKKKLGKQISPLPTLPPVALNGELCPEPEFIVDHRMVKRLGRAATEVRVRWKGASPTDDSWELLWTLQCQYPHLMGKVL
jgi:hypothetical protein